MWKTLKLKYCGQSDENDKNYVKTVHEQEPNKPHQYLVRKKVEFRKINSRLLED